MPLPASLRRFSPLLLAGGFCLALSVSPVHGAPAEMPNLLDPTIIEGFRPAYDPWRGVDAAGLLHGLVGISPAVNAAGQIQNTNFAFGLAAADFGRGVLDLLVVDSQGHFWYYANSGTKEAPKFTVGTPLPAFFGAAPSMIQLIENGSSHGDLLLGTGEGRLFLVRNSGSAIPRYDVPARLEAVEVKTRHDGKPWCNFLSPAYAHWRSDLSRDLLIGDGTYAADNVYYLKNTGTDDRPQFDGPVVLIPGGGREQLSICPWPVHGGRPGLLVGDREGKIVFYVNETGSSDELPRFKPGQPLRLGASESFGTLARLAVADLNGDGKPDLLISLPDGTLKLALNTGTAELPRFDKADPIKGDPVPALAAPLHWTFGAPGSYYGIPPSSYFYLLRTVGGQAAEAATYEEGFTPPEGEAKHAVKLSFVDPPPGESFPVGRDERDQEIPYRIFYTANGTSPAGIPLKQKTDYELRFQLKGTGFDSLSVRLVGSQRLTEKRGSDDIYVTKPLGVTKELDLSSSWHEVRIPFNYQVDKDSDTKGDVSFVLTLDSVGKGAYYISDMSLRQTK